ncbi:serine hydrolase domain-containing protein [uncultured Croceitalea sp.]|uniref:serine hydrolase domain-containing protein n=1 Tax=uncultured Croceitalea sp. TaxID=1798908 RepID=UPI0033060CE4
MRYNLFVIALFVFTISSAQVIQKSTTKGTSIDSLVSSLSDMGKPGFAVGIIEDNRVTYEKYIGLSDVANLQPIDGETKFRLGGMSPHFASYLLLDLIESGQASFNDEIKLYISDFPDYDQDITLKDVFNHSTGLPGYWPLKFISNGSSSERYFNQIDAERFYSRKWKLNFEPGSQYQFSGIAAKLMVQIIEGITKQEFSKYAEEKLFQALAMYNTQFLIEGKDDKNLAKSYQPNSEDLSEVNHFDVGPAGLVSSMEDLLKWFIHLEKDNGIGSKVDEKAFLENGQTLESPNGYLTFGQQFIHEMRDGRYKIWDSGALGGFASSVFRFPKEKITVIVLSNNGVSYNGFVGMQIADMLMGYPPPQPFDYNTLKFKEVSGNYLKTLEGSYFNTTSFLLRELKVTNDTLKYVRPNYGRSNTLLPLSESLFLLTSDYQEDVKLEINKDDNEISGFKFIYEDGESIYKKYKPYLHSKTELNKFIGTYYNKNLMVVLEVFMNGEGKLVAQSKTEPPFELKSFQKNSFLGTPIHFRKIDFSFVKNNTYLTVALHNAKHIDFVKIIP